MEFANGLISGFEPRFRNLGQDHDRYVSALVKLADAGKVGKKKGESLYDVARPGFDWIEDRYFNAGLYDLIEQHHTASGEVFYGPLYPGTAQAAERFVALGEVARAKRLWRGHVALVKKACWWWLDEKRRGFRPMDVQFPSIARQRKDHDAAMARVPEKKRVMLELLADYRAFLERVGASERELARVDRDVGEIESEKRTPPGGKPDPRALDEDLFWEIIAGNSDLTPSERLEALPETLARFKPKTIRDFGAMAREKWNLAYRTDVWGLAYLLRGGCSDDSFMGFRGWLVLAGREVFEGVLADPDAFDVSLFPGDTDGCESLLEAAEIAYELRAGKPMRPIRGKPAELTGPDWEEEEFAARLPRVAAALEWEG